MIVIVLSIIGCTLVNGEGFKVVSKKDRFTRTYFHTFQELIDDKGDAWKRKTTVHKLEVLINDRIEGAHDTCFLETKRKFQNNDIAKNLGKFNEVGKSTFKEVAKKVGFQHVHRKRAPVRPHCRFNQVVYSQLANTTSRMFGELCTMEMLTGGAAVGDYDNDGYQDVFFTVALSRSLLYRNNGDGTFTDVTVSANVGPALYGNGAGWIDVDADGDLDLLVTTVGDSRHYLYINYGGHFTEEALQRGVAMQFPDKRNLIGFTPSFGDFDLDGYLDIYVSEWTYHFHAKVSANRLLRNMGAESPGYFEDVTEQAGLNMDTYWKFMFNQHNVGTFVFGSTLTDFNNDGWPDILVTGDFGQSKMFWNNGNGTFERCPGDCGFDGFVNAMGSTTADLNNDGFIDVMLAGIYFTPITCKMATCLYGNSGNGLYINNQNKTFSNVAQKTGVQQGHWSWGASFIDYDNDGLLDVVATNGMDSGTTLDDEYIKDNMQLFHNNGKKMVDRALLEGMKFTGQGRGLLVFDFEQDGDEDILVVSNFGPLKFFKNTANNKNNWLRVRVLERCLNNTMKLCDSYGARVYLTQNTGVTQSWSTGSKTNFLGQSELTVHFGLGNNTGPVKVVVKWPHTMQMLMMQNINVNRKIRVIKPDSEKSVTIDASSINACPALYIKEVTQPLVGKVSINPDRMSLFYDPSPKSIFDVGALTFNYTVESSNLTAAVSEVSLDLRTIIEPVACKDGVPVTTVELKSTSERRYDGVSNNIANIQMGAKNTRLMQLAPHSYGDNISQPAGACTGSQVVTRKCPYPTELSGVGSNRPSPRLISNILMKQTKDNFSKRNMSDLTMHYGQFIIHDTDHTSSLPRFGIQYHENHVWMPITIPKGDVYFDPYNTGKETMPFLRSQYKSCTGGYPGNSKRKQLNFVSSYIDGSLVYGSSVERCSHLREFKGGRMRMENTFPPKNTDGITNSNPTAQPYEKLYITGDVRANVQPGLIAMHTLFLREHNRLAREYQYKNPTASDEEIFQNCRRSIIGQLQSITYNEYLPAILGGNVFPKYKGYNATIDPSMSNEFTTAAFRFGHSQVNSLIYRLRENGNPIKEGHGLLREMYFKPHRLEREGGLDPVLRGALAFRSQEVDLLMVDEMRNSLFKTSAASAGRHTGFDLAAINIQRGRDHGLADLNTVRKHLGLKAYTSFTEITRDAEVTSKLRSLYADISNIDLWVGGLAEDHVKNSELGETFHKIIVEQFIRLRNGDRFWYEAIFTPQEIKAIESRTLGQVIRLNTGVKECPDNPFFSKRHCSGEANQQCVAIASGESAIEELKRSNLWLVRENEDKAITVRMLVIITVVIGVVCLTTLVLLYAVAKRAKKKTRVPDEKLEKASEGFNKTVELGVPNGGI